MNDKWKIWERNPAYGDLLYKRAIGDEQEMESSKVLCEIISRFYSPKMSVLDVGCGAGHYLLSLRERVDPNIKYYGIDATEYYVELANKAFSDRDMFSVGNIFDLKFDACAFDIVISSNVILHLPPPPTKAIEELIRVSIKYIIIRTLFGDRNYIIKELRTSDEIEGENYQEKDLISLEGEVRAYNYFNMYTKQYFLDIIKNISPDIEISIEPDVNWQLFDNRKLGGSTATRIINGKQVSGNLILDWHFIVLKKRQ